MRVKKENMWEQKRKEGVILFRVWRKKKAAVWDRSERTRDCR